MHNVICMKWGTRYDPSYVNILASSVRRHLPVPHRFVCFTDDPVGIDPRVETRPIAGMIHDPSKPERGWMKLSILGNGTDGLEGSALFLDLDIVILGEMTPFFEMPGEFRIIRDWNLRGGVIGNSSVFRFELGKHEDVLRRFLDREEELRAKFRNEQAYLSMAIYRHYDLKKYVEIQYRAGDLILAVSVLVAVSAIYYLGNFWLYVVGVVLAGVYAVAQNRIILNKLIRKIKRR